MMELPEDIEHQIIEYLCLEYGEQVGSQTAPVSEDLKYDGIHEVNGIDSHCWSYPTLHNDMWVIAFILDNELHLGMDRKPKELREDPYKNLIIRVEGQLDKVHKVPLEMNDEHQVASSKAPKTLIDIGNRKNIGVHAEVCFTPNPCQVSLSILFEGKRWYLQSRVGLSGYVDLDSETRVYLTMGDISW